MDEPNNREADKNSTEGAAAAGGNNQAERPPIERSDRGPDRGERPVDRGDRTPGDRGAGDRNTSDRSGGDRGGYSSRGPDDRGDSRSSYRGGKGKTFFRRKVCKFCTQKIVADYKNPDGLRRFVTERGKILPRRITGTCAKHQRSLSREVKRARSLVLLPFAKK